MTLRLLIVARDARGADEVRRALGGVTHCRIVGYLPYERAAAVRGGDDAPDVIVIDGSRREDRILAQLPAIRAAAPGSRLVLLADELDDEWLAAAVGVDAVILRTLDPATLATLVGEIAVGTIFHPASRTQRSVRVVASRDPSLTARELEILQMVAAGASNARIAARLWVTEQTVKFHLSNVYRKLGVANRTQASHYAHVKGLLAPAQHVAAVAAANAA